MCRDICRRNTEQDPRDGDVHDRGFRWRCPQFEGLPAIVTIVLFDRRSADGKAQCDNPSLPAVETPRLRVRYLFRQDRNSDAEQNDPCFRQLPPGEAEEKDHIIVQRERKAAYVRNLCSGGQRDRGKRRGYISAIRRRPR